MPITSTRWTSIYDEPSECFYISPIEASIPAVSLDEDDDPETFWHQQEANAQLIAAAPDLYEAWKEFEQQADLMGWQIPPELVRPIALLRLAAQKATGGANE